MFFFIKRQTKNSSNEKFSIYPLTGLGKSFVKHVHRTKSLELLLIGGKKSAYFECDKRFAQSPLRFVCFFIFLNGFSLYKHSPKAPSHMDA